MSENKEKKRNININLGDNVGAISKEIGHTAKVMLDAFLITLGSMLIFVGSVPTIYTTPPVMGPLIAGLILFLVAITRIVLRKSKTHTLNKLASLIVSSNLRRIDDIVRLSGSSEVKVIDNLRILTSASSTLKLGNDARYLKGAKLNLQTMEVILSDKYVEKEPWTCIYCRSVNEIEALVCASCHAPKKKL